MSDEKAMAPPACEHYWAWVSPAGTSEGARLCMLCHQPSADWLNEIAAADRSPALIADIEALCVLFHDTYEAAAAEAGWQTQARSRKPWAEVPEANKETMRATIGALLASGSITFHPAAITPCPTCDGAGVVDTSPPGVAHTAPWLLSDDDCPACGGSGLVDDDTDTEES